MKNVKEYAAPALVLFIIGLIATLLLGVTNDITAPKIAALAAETEKKSRQIVLPTRPILARSRPLRTAPLSCPLSIRTATSSAAW